MEGAEEAYHTYLNNNIIAIVVQLEFMSTNLLTTRSDIQSLLGIHEFYSHGILGLKNSHHDLVFQIVSNHPTWKTVSSQMRRNYNKPDYKPKK